MLVEGSWIARRAFECDLGSRSESFVIFILNVCHFVGKFLIDKLSLRRVFGRLRVSDLARLFLSDFARLSDSLNSIQLSCQLSSVNKLFGFVFVES